MPWVPRGSQQPADWGLESIETSRWRRRFVVSRNSWKKAEPFGACLRPFSAALQMGVLSLWLAASLLSGHPDSLDLSIKSYARSLQPGEVVRLTVESPKPLLSLEARVFERTFSGHPASPLVWNVLVGVDLDTSAGSQDVVLAGTLESGEDFSQNYRLVIEDKVFPTRRLTVDTKYVNPPAEVLKRIREESQRTRRIFAAITSSRLWAAPFTAPVPGPANSSFGKRSILNGQPRSPHSGTDFSGPTGTPVEAPNSGRVVLVGDLYYSGNTVIVDHGLGLYSYFAHLSRTLVTEGQILEQGDVLGEIGATGRVTGPHLHWAVRLNRTRVDPLSLIAVSGGE